MNRPPLLPDPYVFPAYPPALPDRDTPGVEGPTPIISAEVQSWRAHGLHLLGKLSQGDQVEIDIDLIGEAIARVHITAAGAKADTGMRLARPDQIEPSRSFEVQKGEKSLQLKTAQLSVRISLDPFQIRFFLPDDRLLLEQNNSHRDATGRHTTLPCGYSRVDGQLIAYHDAFTAQPDEHYYGFGEKFTEYDKRGQMLEMWTHNTYGVHTERAYKPVPFFISSRGYGFFVDSLRATRFDMAASNSAVFSVICPDEALEYYIIAGPQPADILQRYSQLVSFPVMPPKWAFGFWMSGGFQAETPQSVIERARNLRKRGIPCELIHIDPYWQRMGAWSDLEWDRTSFPEPEKLIAALREMHFQVCLWENPYLGIHSDYFQQASEESWLLRRPDGEVYVLDLLDGYCPPMGIIDFTNPAARSWFKDQHRKLMKMGVRVFKTDFGESVPADARASNGMTGETLHNLYPLLYNDTVAEVMREEIGGEGLVWARSSFAGGQRHVAQWGADCDCSFLGMAATLRGGLSIAMCGHGFWGHDIGGFYVQPSPEVYARWVAFGMLSPMARAHGVTTRQPWDYGEDALAIFMRYVTLRYSLLPYLYSAGREAVDTGKPIMRPMNLEFPEDACTYTLGLQYMLGPSLLVAPIFSEDGRRSIYLPAGRWTDYWTGERIEGPRSIWVEAPLEVIPLYVRENALIPKVEARQYIEDAPFDLVCFDVYLFEAASYTLHDSDGATQVSIQRHSDRLDIAFQGVKQHLAFRIVPLPGLPDLHFFQAQGQALASADLESILAGNTPGWARDENGVIHILAGQA